MWSFEKRPGLKIYTEIIKLFLESIFELTICLILAFIGFEESGDFGIFWRTQEDVFCSVTTVITSIAIVIFPFFVYYTIKHHFKHLKEREVRNKYGSLYEGMNIKTSFTAQYNTLFMARRILIVYILIFMINLPFFVVQFLLIFSIAHLVYLIGYRPFSHKRD